MWCAKCQSDVAVEARPNSQRLHCATCGTEITPRLNQPPQSPAVPVKPTSGADQAAAGTKNPPQSRSPQDLLARWAGSQMFDPYAPLVTPGSKPAVVRPEVSNPPPRNTPQAATAPVLPVEPDRHPSMNPPASGATQALDRSAKVRVDPAFTEGWSDVPAPHVPTRTRRIDGPNVRTSEREVPDGYRAHAPQGLRGPHFDPARMKAPPVQSFHLAAVMGKYLAYLGATTLTVGAGMVLWGYLGGPTHYAPTGWFTTVVGQMFLFLGVVTLVSAGMEQTTAEVSRRIDVIGDQLNRLEHSVQNNSAAATEAEIEAELRAEIAELRKQLSQRGR